jgi:hypothetical protein
MGVLTAFAVMLFEPAVQVNRPVPRLLTSRAFHLALASKITVEWKHGHQQRIELRTVLDGIAKKWNIGILLDRRVDPTRKIALSLNMTPLKDGIAAIARAASARTVIVGNVVYIGPPASVALLESVVAKRGSEWRKAARTWPRTRRRALLAHPTLHWNDLDRPRELVKNFAAKFRLTVDGLDKIPHDLWAGATVPGCSVSQGLSLLLVQFDLTFRWKPDGSGIVIVPLPIRKTSPRRR